MNEYLKQYVPVAEMIALTFGPDCEVVLHDLSEPEQSVVHIAGGPVTGRKVGDSFTLIISDVLLSRRFENDMVTNYSFKTLSGKPIKSSTVLLRDPSGKVAGAMCINIDTTEVSRHIEWLRSFLPVPEPVGGESSQPPHVQEIVDEIIESYFAGKEPARMTRDEKLDVMRFMDSRGIFLTKGAVDKISEKMGVSKVTIYSYLDELKKQTAVKTLR
ncbi:MAG: PAS domain-containing protein [Pyramidobacter sp.]|nr:PAS domain-containing protein [Pyramidobacter sp.]